MGRLAGFSGRQVARKLRRLGFCRKQKVRSGKGVRFHDERLRAEYGLTHLGLRAASIPWAKE